MRKYQFEVAQYMREDSENDGVVIKTFATIEEFTEWLQSMPYDELRKYDVFTMDITDPNDHIFNGSISCDEIDPNSTEDIRQSLFLYVRN